VPALRASRHGRGAVGESVLAGFTRADGALACDAVPLSAIADAVGTPTYVYSASVIRARHAALTGALGSTPHRIHFSVKANGNLAVLRLLHGLGAGVDIVSGGELYRARCAGFAGSDVVFSGVGKSDDELRDAIAARVLMVNVESADEVERLDALARERGVVVDLGIRVNPDVSAETPHPYTRTGEGSMRFGVPADAVPALVERTRVLAGVRLVGIGMHIGSQIASTVPYEQAAAKMLAVVAGVRRAGVDTLAYLDLGGGLAVSYGGEPGGDVEAYARVVSGAARAAGLTLVLEPGRFLVADAGILLTRVLYRKRSGAKTYVITDAGMTDLLRPSHYQAYHAVEPVVPRAGRDLVDVCGPVCESGDFLALDRELEAVEPGDLLVVRTAGAYGFVMASNYNARPRPAEVMVDGGRWAVVRVRETTADLVAHESATPDWREVACASE